MLPEYWQVFCLSFLFFTGKYFGASTTFVRAAGFVEQAVAPDKVASMDYFIKEKVKVDWQFMFIIGVLLGSLASASRVCMV